MDQVIWEIPVNNYEKGNSIQPCCYPCAHGKEYLPYSVYLPIERGLHPAGRGTVTFSVAGRRFRLRMYGGILSNQHIIMLDYIFCLSIRPVLPKIIQPHHIDFHSIYWEGGESL